MAVVSPPPCTRPRPRWLSRSRVLLADVLFGVTLLAIALAGQLTGSRPAAQIQSAPAQITAHFDGIVESGQSTGFAVAPDGSLAVVDRIRGVIIRLDASGQPVAEWGPSFGPGLDASNLAGITPDGTGWAVLDRGALRIIRLDSEGRALADRTIDLTPLETYGPNGLAVDPGGNLFMADTGRDRLVIFGFDGTVSGVLGDTGSDLGKFKQPMFLACTSDGGFFVTDWENSRVQHFDADRRPTAAWPVPVKAWGIAVDRMDRVYVPDADHKEVRIFSSDGAALAEIGADPSSAIQLDGMTQVGVSPDGQRLWVLGSNGLASVDLAPYAGLQPRANASSRLPLGLLGVALLLVAGVSGVWPRRGQLLIWRSTSSPAINGRATVPVPSVPVASPVVSSRWPSSSRQMWIEVICLVLIVGIALFLRAHDLTTLPHGLHGDEADAGLEGQRILKQGWIGLYSPLALGRPTGPLYLTAISVALMGNTILAVRVIPSIMGVLTVLAVYVVVRRNGPAPLALLSAAVLAVMDWHIHLSRIAFHPATWGLVVVLAAGALLEATRGKHWWWWLVGGALAGTGVYFYQAGWLALAVFGVFVAVYLVVGCLQDKRRRFRPVAILALAFAAGAIVSTLPMAVWAANPDNGYFSSFDLVSSLTKPSYEQLPSTWERATYLGSRYLQFWDRICCHPQVDTIDGTGEAPIVPPLQIGLLVIGLLVALRWWRNPLAQMVIVFLLLAPIGSVVTVDGPARRVFELVPFLAVLTALAAYALLRLAFEHGLVVRLAASSLLAIIFGFVAYQNLHAYFDVFANSFGDKWVFAQESTESALYMAALPKGTRVYFYSARWSWQYETPKFLAPSVEGEDRSQEFSSAHVTDTSLTVRPAAFVLIGGYRGLLDELQARYPGGRTTYGGPQSDPTFVAYELSDGSEAALQEGALSTSKPS
jgi:4-amino-4-deoxy-L-arabinose transferase-like glycosyltransferase/DNA-binding beta-propeller fold protein YncE